MSIQMFYNITYAKRILRTFYSCHRYLKQLHVKIEVCFLPAFYFSRSWQSVILNPLIVKLNILYVFHASPRITFIKILNFVSYTDIIIETFLNIIYKTCTFKVFRNYVRRLTYSLISRHYKSKHIYINEHR